jgi:hypothetical protein
MFVNERAAPPPSASPSFFDLRGVLFIERLMENVDEKKGEVGDQQVDNISFFMNLRSFAVCTLFQSAVLRKRHQSTVPMLVNGQIRRNALP